MANEPHRFHPDPERKDPEDAIVWDDCSACYQNSDDPFSLLDSTNLRRIQDRIAGVLHSMDYYRTEMEAYLGGRFLAEVSKTFGPENVKAPIREAEW